MVKSLSAIALIAAFLIAVPLGVRAQAPNASAVAAGRGAWTFELDAREHPILRYSEDGKEIFLIGCGRAFGVHAIYPGDPKRTGKATVTIATPRTKMQFAGEIESGQDDGRTHFVEWDLGFDRRKPDAFGKAFWRRQSRLFDLLESGPLTISAEGRHYVLPPVNAPGWRSEFKKYC